jgi:hypothetical protein
MMSEGKRSEKVQSTSLICTFLHIPCKNALHIHKKQTTGRVLKKVSKIPGNKYHADHILDPKGD